MGLTIPTGLTVGDLKRLLADLPDDLEVGVGLGVSDPRSVLGKGIDVLPTAPYLVRVYSVSHPSDMSGYVALEA